MMKAIYLKKAGEIEVAEISKPLRGENEILVKIRGMGICGSDVSAYLGTSPMVSYPRIIGHELVGEVSEVDSNDKEFSVGDRVALEPYVYCGKCYPCSTGRTNCCENLRVLGVHIDGGMSEYFSHPRRLVHKLPADLPWDVLAMTEPLTISMHAVNRSRLQEGEHVVITGCGPIGMLAAQYALTLGAVPIMVDPVDERLNFAQAMGVKHTVNLVKTDAIAAIRTITGNRMAEVVIEASGSAAAIRNSIDYVSYAGRIVLVGWPKGEVSLPTALFTKKELDVLGSRNSVRDFPESIRLIASKKISVMPVITKTIKFEEIPYYVADIAAHPENYLKVMAVI